MSARLSQDRADRTSQALPLLGRETPEFAPVKVPTKLPILMPTYFPYLLPEWGNYGKMIARIFSASRQRIATEVDVDQLSVSSRQPEIWLTAHGRRRCQQRGTNARLLHAVSYWADIEVPVGLGTVALSLSANAGEEMIAEGLPPSLVSRARLRALVQAGGRTLTVIAGREARGGRYWRQRRSARHRRALAR